MFETISTLASPTGARLAIRSQPAGTREKGVLLISHGLAEHAGRYGRFARVMAGHGFHVYAHDHRGHGATTAPDAPLGRFSTGGGGDKVLDDVRAVRDHAAAAHPGLPVILFGHSMGGLIALNAAEDRAPLYDGLAVWNANFNPGLAGRAAQAVLAMEKMLKGSDVPSRILTDLTFASWAKTVTDRKTDFDWLSHDAAEVEAYVADPLCGFETSVSMWIDLFDLTFRGANRDRLARLPADLPIHLVGGGEDPATNRGREIHWLSARLKDRGLHDVTTVIYPAMRHETLNELGRDAAMQAFADWCGRVVANRA